MPNGGSDCCGTCWFNAKNKGEAGYAHSRDLELDVCSIRELTIEIPFYTYCANHPHRRSERDPIPIGPVFTGDASGHRERWRDSPDTEEVRRHLLDLLDNVQQPSSTEYPLGHALAEVVVWQLAEFREPRAVEPLRRIAALESLAKPGDFERSGEVLVQLAKDAVELIEQDGA